IPLVVAFWFYAAWQGERELRAAIAELDALGEPWRWDELEAARSPLMDKDDARQLILSVHRQVSRGLLTNRSVELALDRPPYALILPEEFEGLDQAIRENAAALEEARKIADMPNGRLHIPWPA